MMAGSACQTVVACKQHGVQHFGQGYVDSVIRGDVVPQRPNARQQKIVGVSLNTEVSKVVECHTPTFAIDLASCCIFADDLCHFDVEQVRRVQCLPRRKQVVFDRVCRVRAQEHLDKGRRVHDNQ